MRIANGGIAGEISDNGPQQVQDYLALFPNARYFVIGMGTNDLGTWPDTEATSKRIIGNLGKMVQAVQDRGQAGHPFQRAQRQRGHVPARPSPRNYARSGITTTRRLKEFCERARHPVGRHLLAADDEHFADELHPNAEGAKIIAKAVYMKLTTVYNPEQEPVLKTPAPDAIAEARQNPNGWVYEIEGDMA